MCNREIWFTTKMTFDAFNHFRQEPFTGVAVGTANFLASIALRVESETKISEHLMLETIKYCQGYISLSANVVCMAIRTPSCICQVTVQPNACLSFR
jgi:hypothetical protein